MELEPLLCAIQDSAPWLARFRRTAYAGAFREYREAYGELYVQALRELEPGELAEALLEALEAGWRRRRPWNRAAVRMDEKQMLVVYLTPMLLEEEDPDCEALARALQSAWAARRPREAYRVGTFQCFQDGFRLTIMGIPAGDDRKR